MSTTTLSPPRPLRRSGGDTAPARLRNDPAQLRDRAPVAIGAALTLVVLVAVFTHGAVGTAPAARIEVAVALVSVVTAAAVARHTPALGLPRSTLAALGLFCAFVVWCGLSLAWSVAPDGTWLDFNREAAYALALGSAVVLGAGHPSALRRATDAFLGLAAIVCAYALAQKVIPEVHVGSLLDFNRTGMIPRLQEPFGYWNGLALFVAMGAAIALFRVVDRHRPPRARLGYLLATQLMLVTLGFTLSRGAMLALIVAMVLAAPLARAGLGVLLWMGCALLGALSPLVVGLSLRALTDSGVSLGDRGAAGAVLGGVLIAAAVGTAYGGSRVLVLESEIHVTDDLRRRIRSALLAALGVALLGFLVALALSSRGLAGQVSHAWHSFTSNSSGNSVYSPQRLISEDSEHRWGWWKEAAGAFSARPLTGWGDGSFPIVHLLYRRDLLSVAQPHSLPLQFLAETGLVGTGLILGALALLVRLAVRAVRRAADPSERLLRAGVLAATSAFLVQSLYDWGWDIPALALPALLLLGVLAGAGARARADGAVAEPGRPGDRAQVRPAHPFGWRPPAGGLPMGGQPKPWPGAAARLAVLSIAVLLFSTLAVGAALPSLAAGDAASALVRAGGPASGLPGALQQALLASDLNPVSDAGLRVAATVAQRRGDLGSARRYLMEAIVREPTDVQAWELLAEVDLSLGDLDGAAGAARRALQLDPTGLQTGSASLFISQLASLLITSPRDSATALPIPGPLGSFGVPPVTLPPRNALTPSIPTVTVKTTAVRSPVDPSTTVPSSPATTSTTPRVAPSAPTPTTPRRTHTGSGGGSPPPSTVTQTYSTPQPPPPTTTTPGPTPGVTVTTPPPTPTTTTTGTTGTPPPPH